MMTKDELEWLYTQSHLSMMDIAVRFNCSINKVVYWMRKYNIDRRDRATATYLKNNPYGDPFSVQPVDTIEKATLYGMGIGLYWGEGTKANKHSVRLGNTDPELLKMFMRFLIELFGVNKDDLRFGLQIFTDIDQEEAMEYWIKKLDVRQSQFHKTHITISGSIGTYRVKSQYGVVTVYYHRKKLRDILVKLLPR